MQADLLDFSSSWRLPRLRGGLAGSSTCCVSARHAAMTRLARCASADEHSACHLVLATDLHRFMLSSCPGSAALAVVVLAVHQLRWVLCRYLQSLPQATVVTGQRQSAFCGPLTTSAHVTGAFSGALVRAPHAALPVAAHLSNIATEYAWARASAGRRMSETEGSGRLTVGGQQQGTCTLCCEPPKSHHLLDADVADRRCQRMPGECDNTVCLRPASPGKLLVASSRAAFFMPGPMVLSSSLTGIARLQPLLLRRLQCGYAFWTNRTEHHQMPLAGAWHI